MRRLLFAISVLLLGSHVNAQVLGNDLVSHYMNDMAEGSIFMLENYPVSAYAGLDISEWGFYNGGNGVGNKITPLLLERVSGDIVIRGIGTTRSNDGSGVQRYRFGLISGTSTISAGDYYFGWLDGQPGGPANSGVPEFMYGGPSPNIFWVGEGLEEITSVGAQFTPNGALDRTYSVEFTLGVSSAPEPGTLGLFLCGSLLGIGQVVRAKRKKYVL